MDRHCTLFDERGRQRAVLFLAAAMLSGATGSAQEPLTLEAAAALALASHPAIKAAGAGTRQAEAEIHVARAGLLPRIAWAGSYTRSNNPVYAFGTVLNQRRFAESHFAVAALNNPSPVQNYQSVLSIEQTIFDAQRTKHAIRAAQVREELSSVERRGREMDVLLGVLRTYFGVVVARERTLLATQAVASADADLARARGLFASGLTTQADVLAVQVHRATAVQERIRAVNDLAVAGAALNDAIGIAQDDTRDAVTPLSVAHPPTDALDSYVATAIDARPDVTQAALGVELSTTETSQARAALWPTVVAQGAVEANGARFVGQGGSNWLVGLGVRWELWKGSENRARVTALRHREVSAAAQRRQVESATALQVRTAWFGLQSAQERLAVAETTVAQAEESLRIVRNRYESGLDAVTELLRSETALTNARYQRLTALYEQRTARAALEYASGRLSIDSEVMQ